MPDQYMIDRAKGQLAVARYLLSKADERGTTHGEKRHFLFVAQAEIASALFNLSDQGYRLPDRVENTDPQDVGELLL